MSENPQEQIHYCRLALPTKRDASNTLAITRIALAEVFARMEHRLVDPSKGDFRISYNMDSTLERESVVAEWRPRIKAPKDNPSPYPNATPYMTVIPWRSPERKLHANLGFAKNAINAKVYGYQGSTCDMELYEWADGEWKVKYTVAKGTKREDLPWKKDSK